MKKRMTLNFRALFLVVPFLAAPFLSGCGSENPLDSQPEYIQKATPGFQKAQDPVASKDTMIITSNQTHFFFTETVEGQVAISGRVLLDNYQSELSIDNIADFAGATFDAESGLFSWVPPRGFVSGLGSTRTTFLRMRLNAAQPPSADGNVVTATTTLDFPVTVARMERQPTIVQEAGFPTGETREGENLKLTIIVKDEDGVNQLGGKPSIFIQAPVNEPRVGDLTPFIRVVSEDNPERDFADPTLWKFTLNVALNDVDVTKNAGDFYFRVTAVTRFGKKSATKEYRIAIRTDVQQPIISSENFEGKANAVSIQDIYLIDPRSEGRVSVEILNKNELPAALKIDCPLDKTRPSIVVCRSNWNLVGIAAMGQAEVTVRIRATNRSPLSYDNYSVFKDYTLKFKVVP